MEKAVRSQPDAYRSAANRFSSSRSNVSWKGFLRWGHTLSRRFSRNRHLDYHRVTLSIWARARFEIGRLTQLIGRGQGTERLSSILKKEGNAIFSQSLDQGYGIRRRRIETREQARFTRPLAATFIRVSCSLDYGSDHVVGRKCPVETSTGIMYIPYRRARGLLQRRNSLDACCIRGAQNIITYSG